MLPMLLSMFFQQTYNLCDSWIAGNYIGEAALGAVGTCYPVTVCLIAISSGLSLGVSVLVSQSFGAKDERGIIGAAFTSLRAYIPLSLAVTAVGIALAPWAVRALSVPRELHDMTVIYLRIYMAGFIFQFLYNIFTAVLNGLGNSRTPLIILLASCIVNIALDVIFVTVLRFGVAGLALATLLSQAASCLMTALAALSALRQFDAPAGAKAFDRDIMSELLRLGVPSMVQHLFMSFGQLAVQSVINGYGMIVLAGYSAAFRLNGIYINSLMAVSNALTGFIAQNRGAKKTGRIKTGLRSAVFVGYLFTGLVILLMLTKGDLILGSFLGDNENKAAVVSAGMGFVSVVVPSYVIVCLKIMIDGYIRGMGEMRKYLATALLDVAVRVSCGRLLSELWGLDGVWFLWPLAWILGLSLDIVFYFIVKRKFEKNI